MPELFTEKQWLGEFFIPEDYEKRFPGKVEYSPEKGVILSYTITGHIVPPEADVIKYLLTVNFECHTATYGIMMDVAVNLATEKSCIFAAGNVKHATDHFVKREGLGVGFFVAYSNGGDEADNCPAQ